MKSIFVKNANGQIEHWINGELRATIPEDSLDKYKEGLSPEYQAE